ncbi:N-glycan processing [Fragilaria crotonensis]|nr:N-glycan processing [Fragilaria crotonensis]
MALRQRKAKDPILPLYNISGDNDNHDHGADVNTNGKRGSTSKMSVRLGVPTPFGTASRKHSKGEPKLLHTVYLPLVAFFACALGFAYLTISGGQSSHHFHTQYHHNGHQHPELIRPRQKYHQHTAGRLKGQQSDSSAKEIPKTTTESAHVEKRQSSRVAASTPSAGKVKVRCPDGAVGYLNDDYCDCTDGSDESKTSACSHLTVQKNMFHCSDGTGTIYSSRVRDGVKDCLDGSDEQ